MAAPIRNIVKSCFQNTVLRTVIRNDANLFHRCLCSTTATDNPTKYEDLRMFESDDTPTDTPDDSQFQLKESHLKMETASFATLFRHSTFVQLGDMKRRRLIGRIFQVINDDLYIDFGGKFMCCCPRPEQRAHKFFKGQRVLVFINSFEMVGKFMGSEKAITLLEADCTLLRVLDDRRQFKPRSTDRDEEQFDSVEMENEEFEEAIRLDDEDASERRSSDRDTEQFDSVNLENEELGDVIKLDDAGPSKGSDQK